MKKLFTIICISCLTISANGFAKGNIYAGLGLQISNLGYDGNNSTLTDGTDTIHVSESLYEDNLAKFSFLAGYRFNKNIH
jgi:hypothetical protein